MNALSVIETSTPLKTIKVYLVFHLLIRCNIAGDHGTCSLIPGVRGNVQFSYICTCDKGFKKDPSDPRPNCEVSLASVSVGKKYATLVLIMVPIVVVILCCVAAVVSAFCAKSRRKNPKDKSNKDFRSAEQTALLETNPFPEIPRKLPSRATPKEATNSFSQFSLTSSKQPSAVSARRQKSEVSKNYERSSSKSEFADDSAEDFGSSKTKSRKQRRKQKKMWKKPKYKDEKTDWKMQRKIYHERSFLDDSSTGTESTEEVLSHLVLTSGQNDQFLKPSLRSNVDEDVECSMSISFLSEKNDGIEKDSLARNGRNKGDSTVPIAGDLVNQVVNSWNDAKMKYRKQRAEKGAKFPKTSQRIRKLFG